MNNNLMNVIKQIVAEQGEAILDNAERLKPIFKDYTKNEGKEDRILFGRCIEQGFYRRLKDARIPDERRRVKVDLSAQLAALTSMDLQRCTDTVEILDRVINPALPPVPQHGSQPAAPPPVPKPASPPVFQLSSLSALITKKTLIFGIAGAVGGFAGELISEMFREDSQSFFDMVLSVSKWAAFIGLGISIALLAAQNIYLKKRPSLKSIIKPALLGIGTGAIAGGFAQILFSFTADISTLVEVISRIICWGILGWGIGWGVSLFVPNFPKKRAMFAGFLGGLSGGAVFRATFLLPVGAVFGRVIGIAILGLFIGFTISLLEEALREAWLTIIYAKNETRNIALGQKPVVFGSGLDADIGVSDREALVQIENGTVVMYDKQTNQRFELQNGSRIDLGKLSFIVNIKRSVR